MERLVDSDHFKRTSWVGLQALCTERRNHKSNWERGSRRRPLYLGTDPDGYNIELARGFIETPERLAYSDGASGLSAILSPPPI